jgi:hypothetical protein
VKLQIDMPDQEFVTMMHEISRAHVHVPNVLPDERDLSAYKRLASSVIILALNDAQKEPCSGDDCLKARRFLCGDSRALRLWCRWLNVHPDWIRAEAQKRGWCN